MSRKIVIREVYFYQNRDSNLFTIDMVNAKNKFLHKEFKNLNRLQVSELLEKLKSDKHSKYTESKKGMKVFNKYPEDKIMAYKPLNIFNVYMDNLKELQESSESRYLAANLLRAAADILHHHSLEDDEETYSEEPEELEVTGIDPEPANTTIVPFEVIDKVQSDLDTAINLNNLTFWFNSQKWQLQAESDITIGSIPKRPKSSNTISSSMDYMQTLLGVNGETSLDPDYLMFRFTFHGKVYKISHIYTSDSNTI